MNSVGISLDVAFPLKSPNDRARLPVIKTESSLDRILAQALGQAAQQPAGNFGIESCDHLTGLNMHGHELFSPAR
jgi:hypothetical protein